MKKKFNVEVEMEERWIPHFYSMLKYMESLGKMGGSRIVGLYSDGDGDYRPKFNFGIDVDKVEPNSDKDGDRIYDAG